MNPLYQNDLIYLKPFTEKFTKEGSPYLDWFHDKDVTMFNSHGLFSYTKKAQEEFLATLYDGSKTVFAIIAKKTTDKKFEIYGGVHIGNCSLQQIDWVNHSAEFAIVIGNREYWKKGIGTICLEFMLEHAFVHLNLFRVWTGTVSTNKGMMKVARKCNMVEEGTFRQAVYLYGMYYDVVEFGILKSEWAALHK